YREVNPDEVSRTTPPRARQFDETRLLPTATAAVLRHLQTRGTSKNRSRRAGQMRSTATRARFHESPGPRSATDGGEPVARQDRARAPGHRGSTLLLDESDRSPTSWPPLLPRRTHTDT